MDCKFLEARLGVSLHCLELPCRACPWGVQVKLFKGSHMPVSVGPRP